MPRQFSFTTPCDAPSTSSWPLRRCVEMLVRAASFRCKSPSTTLTSCASMPPSASEWAMVPVLNELLARTASQREVSSSSRALERRASLGRRRRSACCLNCQRTFSQSHDAASRPADGYCSVDCRASHQYMKAIDDDLGLDGKWCSPSTTLDSSFSSSDYSSADPLSHLTLAPSATALQAHP